MKNANMSMRNCLKSLPFEITFMAFCEQRLIVLLELPRKYEIELCIVIVTSECPYLLTDHVCMYV
jgi:hypothetical protein